MKIGLLTGAGESFSGALSERIVQLSSGADSVEALHLGLIPCGAEAPCDLILDRCSHQVPYYRSWLKEVARQGLRVINDPFCVESLDNFSTLGRLSSLGLPIPKTILAPQKSYDDVAPAALEHLEFPLDWDAAVEDLGGVLWLKPVRRDPQAVVRRVEGTEALLAAYDQSGSSPMILQADVPWDRFIRVFTVGEKTAIVARYDPAYRQYLLDPDYLDPELEEEIARGALGVSRHLKLDINAVDIALVGDRWWIIDPAHPHPDFERDSLTPVFFEKVVAAVAELCLSLRPAQADPSFARSASKPKSEDLSLRLIQLEASETGPPSPGVSPSVDSAAESPSAPRGRTGEMETPPKDEAKATPRSRRWKKRPRR